MATPPPTRRDGCHAVRDGEEAACPQQTLKPTFVPDLAPTLAA